MEALILQGGACGQPDERTLQGADRFQRTVFVLYLTLSVLVFICLICLFNVFWDSVWKLVMVFIAHVDRI